MARLVPFTLGIIHAWSHSRGALALQGFHVLFVPPDDQWIPAVVAEHVLAILTKLHSVVRTILSSSILHFLSLIHI